MSVGFATYFGGNFSYNWVNKKVTTFLFLRELNLKVSQYFNSP